MKGKAIATFLGGFAASQALFHGALAASGIEFTMLGISYTRSLNLIAALASAIVTILLLSYAWRK